MNLFAKNKSRTSKQIIIFMQKTVNLKTDQKETCWSLKSQLGKEVSIGSLTVANLPYHQSPVYSDQAMSPNPLSFQQQTVPWEDVTIKLIYPDGLITKFSTSIVNNKLRVIRIWFQWGPIIAFWWLEATHYQTDMARMTI